MSDLSENKEEKKKLDWMYRDATQIVDREEYLLGRKIDNQLEASLLPPSKDQECLPPSIFTRGVVESQVDIARKLQEDPLYLIKKKEIECREQLLKNPRKMKQLQEMIARQQAASEKLKRKQLKERKKKKLDALLVNKCNKIFGGEGTKKLAYIETNSSSSSSSKGSSESDEDIPKKKKKKRRKDIDRLLAIKYKKVIGGNLDLKGLAEIDSNSESSREDEGNVKVKRKKDRSPIGSSEESRKPNVQKKIKKKNEMGRKYSSSESESKPRNKKKATKKEYYNARQGSSIGDDKRYTDYRSRKQSSSVNESKQIGRSSSNEDIIQNKIHSVRRNTDRGRSEDRRNEYSQRTKHNEKYDKKLKNERDNLNEKSYDKSRLEKREISQGERIKTNHKSTKHKNKSQRDYVRHNVKEEESSRSSSDSSHCKNNRDIRKRKSEIKKSIQSDSFSERKSRKIVTSKRYEEDPTKYRRESSTSLSSESSSEEQRSQPKRQYGLVLPANYVPKRALKEEIKPLSKKEDELSKPYKREDKQKLTDEEKNRKLKEMMDNAKWRDEQRDKNIKSFKEKEKAEKDDYVYNENFMRKQMAIAVSQGTVESRVKANINTIQRSSTSMSENFARRK